MKTRKCILILISLLSISTFIGTQVWSHDLWITMETYQLEKSAIPAIAIFSSHQFPATASDYLSADRLDKAFIITPAGGQVATVAKPDGTFGPPAAMSEKGTYLAVALPVNGFATKTTEGYQRGKNKKEVSNAIACSYSQKFAKSIFSVGKPSGEVFAKPLGHAMEIVPQKNPALVKVGEVLPVLVLLEGKPARTMVFGTYAGFSETSNTFAYTTRTNKEGIADIKMIHNGAWVLIVKQEEAYPDAAECDKRTVSASLTFEIQ
jgi:uncharacterized GH25 family protein